MDDLDELLCALAQGQLPVDVGAEAAVFDVDGTLVHRGAPLARVCELLRHCARRGVECYIVTARVDVREGRAQLKAELRGAGVDAYLAGVYMRPEAVRPRTLAAFKAHCRLEIARRSQRAVVLCVGDQWHDLPMPQAGNGDVAVAHVAGCLCVKLPAEATRPWTGPPPTGVAPRPRHRVRPLPLQWPRLAAPPQP